MKLVEVEFIFPSTKQAIVDRRAEINLFMAAQIQTNRGMLFDHQGAYNGHSAWAPGKWRQGMVLSKRGTLRKSIGPKNAKGKPGPGGIVKFAGDVVEVGTALAYAAMMNWGTTNLPGGKLVPKHANALKIPLPQGYPKKRGEKFLFRKWIKIPARRFDEWNHQDMDEFSTALVNKVMGMAFGEG